MRTFKAALSGFVVASALIFAARWAFGGLATPAMPGEYHTHAARLLRLE